MKPWRVILNGVDITRRFPVQTRFEAENICGEVSADLADRDALAASCCHACHRVG